MDTEAATNGQLIRGRVLARSVLWNLAGNGIPLFAALLCVPVLIRAIGTGRFGVLTLAWALVGYFGLFDMGLGRALTKLVAEKLGTGDEDHIPALFRTSLVLMAMLGLAGGGVLAGVSPLLVNRLLRIPATLRGETLTAFYLLAAALPFVITTAGLRGFLEAHQRFDQIIWARMPLGILTYAGPLLILKESKSLVAVVGVLVVIRVLAWGGYLWLCLRLRPGMIRAPAVEARAGAALARLGVWMTVSNLVSPLMGYLDRFLIGGLISVAAVAYYATPYEIVTKLLLIPGVIVGVTFPAFSASFTGDRRRTPWLFERAVQYVILALFPTVLATVAFAREGLTLWLGPVFASCGAAVLEWLAAGVFLNALAQVPFAQLQGAGRPDLTAKLHLVELPLYLGALVMLLRDRGIEGAAMAWTARVALDAVILFSFSWRLLPGSGPALRRIAATAAAALILCAAAARLSDPLPRLLLVAAAVAGFGAFSWCRTLTPFERQLVLHPYQSIQSRN